MRCHKSFLDRVAFLVVLAAIGAVWAGGASAESFDWRNNSGNWIEPVIGDQAGWGGCYAFCTNAMLETNYYMTRNDSTYKPDLSTKQIKFEEQIHGQVPILYQMSTGVVVEQELPFNDSNYSTNWPLSTGWENRVYKCTNYTAWGGYTIESIKSVLKQFGPVMCSFSAGIDYYEGPTADVGGAHTNAIVGFQDDAAVPGGGYWIVKNSWGAGWSCDGMEPGYGKIAYAWGILRGHSGQAMNGAAYYTGSLASANWTGGAGTWASGSSTKWTNNYDSSAYAWENKETNATFAGTGGAVTVSGSVIAHGMTINSTGYTFSGGSITTTAGGLTAAQSTTISSNVYIGGPQSWNVASGKLLTVSGPLHTIISDLTFSGAGTTTISTATINGGGMINNMGRKPGGLIQSGTGRVNLTGGSVNFAGDITVNSGSGGLYITPSNGTATYSGDWFGAGNTYITSTTGIVSIGGGYSNYTGNISKSTGGTLSFIPANGFVGTFGGVISGTTTIMQNGAGTTVLSGANTYSGTTTISAGALQANIGTGIPSSSFLRLNGGVLQSNSAITFTRSLGTSGTRFSMTSYGGGFSAGGGQMTVNIGGGTNLTWGTTVGTYLVGTLKLSSQTATAATVFQNNINLNGSQRTIQVDDNPTYALEDYGYMTGILSGTGSSGINKTGNGTLILGGVNTYAGTTTISAGAIQADIGGGIPSASHLRLNGGVWQSGAASTFTRVFGTTGSTFAFGTGGGGFSGGSTDLTVNIGGDLRTVTWGTTVGTQIVGTLKLGSPSSSHHTTFANPINLNGGSRTIDTNSFSPDVICSVLSNVISGSGGSLTKTGNTALWMTGESNTYTGSTTVTQGNLFLNKTGIAIPGDLVISGGTNSVIVAPYQSGQFASNCKVTFANNQIEQFLLFRGYDTTLAGLVDPTTFGVVENSRTEAVSPMTLTINNSTDCVFAGILLDTESGSGAISLVKTGTGSQTLEGRSILYSGTTTINEGTLVFKDIVSSTVLDRPITDNGMLGFNTSVRRDMICTGLVSGTGGVSVTGIRSTALTNNNTYTGETVISGGQLTANDGTGIPSASTIVLDGGVMQSINAGSFTRTLGTAAGQVYFSANGGGFAALDSNLTVNLGGGTALTWGTTVGTNILGTLKLNSITAKAGTFIQNNIDLNGTVRTIQVDDNTAYALQDFGDMLGVLSGTGSSGINKTGTGTLILEGFNTYSGTTTLSDGMLLADIGRGIPSASFMAFNGGIYMNGSNGTFTRALGTSGATFSFGTGGGGFAGGSSNLTVNIGGDGRTLTWGTTVGTQLVGTLKLSAVSSSHSTTFANPINLNGAVRTVQVDAGAATMTGVLSGTGGGLTKTGPGQLFLTAANTYTGATTVTGGSLVIGANGTTGAIAGSSIVNNAALGFYRSDAYTYAGTISGSGSFWQIGSGTTTLTATNHTYTGGTNINAGTLVAASLGKGNISVASGTKLQMTSTLPLTNYATLTNGGTVTGTVTLADNAKATGPGTFGDINILSKGVFQPGTGQGVATATCTGNVTWNPGGKYRLDLTGLDDAYSDLWNIAGNLSITSTYMADPFEIEPLSISTATAYPGLLSGFDNTQSYDWKIAAVTGTISGFSSSTVVVDTGVFQNTLAGAMSVETRDSGHSVYLVYTPGAGAAPPVPEPSTLAMLFTLGIGALGVRIYRKRS